MTELTVGIRELKMNLSAYVAKANKGQTIVITSHGQELAQLMPRKEEDIDARIKALVEAGVIHWNGKKLRSVTPVTLTRSDVLASDVIIEMRNESLY
jgi:prevent-host-death family protein